MSALEVCRRAIGGPRRVAAICALAGLVPPPATAADAPAPPPLTLAGVTVYGTVDVGLAYLSHGAPLSGYFAPGLPFLIQKFSNRPIVSVAPNGLGQSKLGLAGRETIGEGIAAVFRLETGFQPTSGSLSDGPRSLVLAGGLPLSQQTTNGDTSRAGQAFQGAAYAGVASPRFGALTFGRQNSLMLDDLILYDPQAQSYAFSPIGYSGVAGGGGDTEDARLDTSLKYVLTRGPAHLAYLHQFSREGGGAGGADEADLGASLAGLSVDTVYTHVQDAIAVASLTAAQAAASPGTLAATVSDNRAWSIQARFDHRAFKLFGGYEHIDFADPSHPLAPGASDFGGYRLSVVNDTAFKIHKILQVSWVGLRYAATRSLALSGAYYHYDQGSYAADRCADASAAACAGVLNAISLVADYRLTRHFDIYAGLTHSRVAGGLAAGYLNAAVTATMSGARFSF